MSNDLSNLSSKLDKLHIGELETTLRDLSKLSYALKNDVVKKTEYDELIKKSMLFRLLILVNTT